MLARLLCRPLPVALAASGLLHAAACLLVALPEQAPVEEAVLPVQLLGLEPPPRPAPAVTRPERDVEAPRLRRSQRAPRRATAAEVERRALPPPAAPEPEPEAIVPPATAPPESPPAPPAPPARVASPPPADAGAEASRETGEQQDVAVAAPEEPGPRGERRPAPGGGAAPESAPPAAEPRRAAGRADSEGTTGATRWAQPSGGYQVRPGYPPHVRRLGVQGTTLLRIHVLADGSVGEVRIETSAGHADLDRAAAEAVRRWRFDPARRGEEAVSMWVLLPVEFRLK